MIEKHKATLTDTSATQLVTFPTSTNLFYRLAGGIITNTSGSATVLYLKDITTGDPSNSPDFHITINANSTVILDEDELIRIFNGKREFLYTFVNGVRIVQSATANLHITLLFDVTDTTAEDR